MDRKLVTFLTVLVVLMGVGAWLVFTAHIPVRAEQPGTPEPAEAEQDSNWPQQGYDPQRTSYNPNEWKLGTYNIGELDNLWTNSVDCTINSGPTVVDGIVYYGHYCGEFLAVDASTGATVWSQSINTTEMSHDVVDGVAYVAARCTYEFCGMVYAFDAASGTPIWTWNPGTRHTVDLLVAEGVVYVTISSETSGISIQALDADTGDELWNVGQGGVVAVDNGMLYVTTWVEPITFRVLDATDGNLLWTGSLEGSSISRPVVAVPYVFINSDNGYLYAFDSAGCGESTCSPEWVGSVPGEIGESPQAPAVAYGSVFVGAGNHFFMLAANGCGQYNCEPLWSTATACQYFPNGSTSPSVANGVVYSPCGTDHIYAFDVSDGEILWEYITPAEFRLRASPAIADGRLFHAATFNFNLYAFEAPWLGVFLSPENQTRDAIPGENVAYEITLSNNTEQSDRFLLDISENNWPTELSITETPTLSLGSSITFTVSLTVPESVSWYTTDQVLIKVTSVTDPVRFSATAEVVTRVYRPPDMTIDPLSISSTIPMDQVYTRTLSIQNGYGVTLTFDILGSSPNSMVSFNTASTELYGYSVPEAWLRVIGLWEDTQVQVIDLKTGMQIDNISSLDRYEIWDVYPSEYVHYKVISSKPVVAYSSDLDGYGHMTFVPSIESGPIGDEFIFYFHCGDTVGDYCYVFATEDAQVDIYKPSGELVASQLMETGDFWFMDIPAGVYHIVSSGQIGIEIFAEDSYSTVPSINGSSTGYLFYFATHFQETGAFAVFAYEDARIDVYDLENDQLLYSHQLDRGEYWWQTNVNLKQLRLVSTGLVEVWAGSTEGGTAIENLGDDLSFTTGNAGLEFYTHSLMEGSILFAPYDDTRIDIDGLVYKLDKDDYLHLAGCCHFRHIQTDKPILIETLGGGYGWGSTGTYLGGVVSRDAENPVWLSANPLSGTVPSGQAQSIAVTFDAHGLQPDVYTTKLLITSNDPLIPFIQVPVTMTVLAPDAPLGIGISGPDLGMPGHSYTFAAEVTPITTTLPIEYAWQATDQPLISHTGGLTDSVSFNWETTGEKVITVTASNAGGSAAGSHTITLVILDQQAYLPAVMRAAPAFLERIDWR